MGAQDPFSFLPFECANIILRHFSAAEVVRCEQVGRQWRTFLHTWIASVGIRIHFPDCVEPEIGSDIPKAIHRFKRMAARKKNFLLGQPTDITKMERTTYFQAAGDYATWSTNDGVFWRNISRLPDGSSGPVHQLERLNSLVNPADILSVALNADGYLLLGVSDADIDGNRQNGVAPAGRPLVMGKERLYHVTRPDRLQEADFGESLLAYDIITGELLYNVKLPSVMRVYIGEPRPRLVHAAGVECIVLRVARRRPQRVTRPIAIFNGATGSIHQEIECPSEDEPRFSCSPYRRTEFAVVSAPRSGPPYRKIERFTQNPNGRFCATRREIVLPTSNIVLDPFMYLACVAESPALITALSLVPDPDSDRSRAALERHPWRDRGMLVDRVLTAGERRQVNTGHPEANDPHHITNWGFSTSAEFLDKQRVLIEALPWPDNRCRNLVDRYDLFDFTPRFSSA